MTNGYAKWIELLPSGTKLVRRATRKSFLRCRGPASNMASLSREIATLRQAIANAEEAASNNQILEILDQQFTSWDDLVVAEDGDAARTRLENAIEKCRKVQADSEAEVRNTYMLQGCH